MCTNMPAATVASNHPGMEATAKGDPEWLDAGLSAVARISIHG